MRVRGYVRGFGMASSARRVKQWVGGTGAYMYVLMCTDNLPDILSDFIRPCLTCFAIPDKAIPSPGAGRERKENKQDRQT